jgi:hypothetical protein
MRSLARLGAAEQNVARIERSEIRNHAALTSDKKLRAISWHGHKRGFAIRNDVEACPTCDESIMLRIFINYFECFRLLVPEHRTLNLVGEMLGKCSCIRCFLVLRAERHFIHNSNCLNPLETDAKRPRAIVGYAKVCE